MLSDFVVNVSKTEFSVGPGTGFGVYRGLGVWGFVLGGHRIGFAAVGLGLAL